MSRNWLPGCLGEHGRGHGEAFVASERNGTWRTAIELPRTAALATVNSVSCAPAGNCTAGGSYANRPGRQQAFVASQT